MISLVVRLIAGSELGGSGGGGIELSPFRCRQCGDEVKSRDPVVTIGRLYDEQETLGGCLGPKSASGRARDTRSDVAMLFETREYMLSMGRSVPSHAQAR